MYISKFGGHEYPYSRDIGKRAAYIQHFLRILSGNMTTALTSLLWAEPHRISRSTEGLEIYIAGVGVRCVRNNSYEDCRLHHAIQLQQFLDMYRSLSREVSFELVTWIKDHANSDYSISRKSINYQRNLYVYGFSDTVRYPHAM